MLFLNIIGLAFMWGCALAVFCLPIYIVDAIFRTKKGPPHD